MEKFEELPKSETCRLINFEQAEVHPGIVSGTYILVVSGKKSYVNMEVYLKPLTYEREKMPEYWGIEVIGCLPGFGLPAFAPYTVTLSLEGIRGTKGIEVLGAKKSKKIKLPLR
jgi:hypothetical protein